MCFFQAIKPNVSIHIQKKRSELIMPNGDEHDSREIWEMVKDLQEELVDN